MQASDLVEGNGVLIKWKQGKSASRNDGLLDLSHAYVSSGKGAWCSV